MRPKIQPTFLILAAGMDSHYDRLKRMDSVVPSGETILGHLRRMLSAFLKTHDHNDRSCAIGYIRVLFARDDYLATAAEFLTPAEKKLLPFSGKLITFEIGIRFLTDFLEGDIYFKVHRENHNLDRCRTQFKLVESIAQQEEPMNKLVEMN